MLRDEIDTELTLVSVRHGRTRSSVEQRLKSSDAHPSVYVSSVLVVMSYSILLLHPLL